jgi:hypothetical protein
LKASFEGVSTARLYFIDNLFEGGYGLHYPFFILFFNRLPKNPFCSLSMRYSFFDTDIRATVSIILSNPYLFANASNPVSNSSCSSASSTSSSLSS